ncbi:MAG: Transcriptional regulator, IclR family, partial [uncultured Caballeronia sp.]
MLVDTAEGYTLNELSVKLGRTVSEIFRMVVTLERRGYVQYEPPRESWRLVNLSRYWHSSSIAELPVAVCLSFCGRDIAERFH